MDLKFRDKPHAVCIPSPFQSHLKAMVQFAKLLHHKGFHITFVNTEFNHRRLLNARGLDALDGISDFKFEAISDGLPASDPNASQDLSTVLEATRTNFLPPFLELLSRLNSTSNSNMLPVSCIVSDGFMPFTIVAAETIGVPLVSFFTIAACSLMGFTQYRALKDKGLLPLEDESYATKGHMDMNLDWIPGKKNIRLKDIPLFLRSTDPDGKIFEFVAEAVDIASKASATVVHTFDALEHDAIEALSSIYDPIYAIGPIPLLVDRIPNVPAKSIGYNLWSEQTECLQWLDSREKNSVLYVNFGSLTVLKTRELNEFAWGIANTRKHFLWVIRPDLVIDPSAVLPNEFIEETKERCMISGWCPQEDVLKHPSVGGFLTHCGWNSNIESICAGVPLICWPFFGDQHTNCRYSCNEWGIGLDMDFEVGREEVEMLVRELMEGEKGQKAKQNVMEWKKKAEEATTAGGSSSMNFEKLLHKLLSNKLV